MGFAPSLPERQSEMLMFKRSLWLCCLLLVGRVCWSQTNSQNADSGVLYPAVDLYVGYLYGAPGFGDFSQNHLSQGVEATFGLRFNQHWAGALDVGDFAESYNPQESSNTTTVLFGPRYYLPMGRTGKYAPFVDVLGGVSHFLWNSNNLSYSPFINGNSGSVAVDMGVDVRLTTHLRFRGQGGYLHTSFTAIDPTQQSAVNNQHGRASAGVVWRF